MVRLLPALVSVPLASAACTREALLAAASSYVTAISTGSLSALPLASNYSYMENNKPATLSRAPYLSSTTPLKIDLTRSTADTVSCATYTLIISTSGGSKPFILATQLRHPDDDPSTISLVDTIAATTGSLFFNAAKTLGYIKAQTWAPIAESSRANRTELKRHGDAYLDMWTDKNAATSIQWGADCERVEGSQFTKPCGAGLPRGGSKKENGMRRYVIDETVGSVDVLCSFDSIGNYPDSHEIRVEGGKVKYVHTVTV